MFRLPAGEVGLRDGVRSEVVEDPDPRCGQPEPGERCEAELEVVRLCGFLGGRRQWDTRKTAQGCRRRVAELADPQRCRRSHVPKRREDPLGQLAATGEVVRSEEIGPRTGRKRRDQRPQVSHGGHAGDRHGDRGLFPEEVTQPRNQLAGPGERRRVRRVDLVPELDERDPRVADVPLEHGASPPFRALDVPVCAPPVEQRQLDAEPVPRGDSDQLAQALQIPLLGHRVADEVCREDDPDDIGVQAPQAAEVGVDSLRAPGLPHVRPAGVGGVVADDAEVAGDLEPIDIGDCLGRARGRETGREEKDAEDSHERSDPRPRKPLSLLNVATKS